MSAERAGEVIFKINRHLEEIRKKTLVLCCFNSQLRKCNADICTLLCIDIVYGYGLCLCAGAVVDNQGSKDAANPAIINVGDNAAAEGQRSPSRGRSGGRGDTRLADVILEHPSPLGPTSARLRWDVSSVGPALKRKPIDGFHIKYRPVLDAERGENISVAKLEDVK